MRSDGGERRARCCDASRRSWQSRRWPCIVPAVLAATPAHVLPTQRIDVKVLLVSADGTEPGFGAWKAELDARGRSLRHLRRLQRPEPGRDADRRRPRRLRRQPRLLRRGHPRHRRPRPQRGQRQRHHELPLRAQRRRVGEPRQVRADVRDPPAQRLHRALSRARAQRRRRRDPGRQRRRPDAAGQGGVPLPQGTRADRQRRPDGAPRRSATPRRRSTRRTGRPSSPAPTAPPTSGSTRIPTTGARRWS